MVYISDTDRKLLAIKIYEIFDTPKIPNWFTWQLSCIMVDRLEKRIKKIKLKK